MKKKVFIFDGRAFTVSSENTLSDALITPVSRENGVSVFKVDMRIADENAPGDVDIDWDEPICGVVGFWAPGKNRGKHIPQSWYAQRVYSSLTDGAPVAALFNTDSRNFRTFALSESEKAFELSLWLKNDPGRDTLHVRVRAFCNEAPLTDSFTFYLRIDERKVPLAQSVKAAGEWWREFYPSDKRKYSESFAGDMPLFSSWYACFQSPRQEVLEKELPVISELGFKSMIIDDGWSYNGNGDGAYSYCGSWEVSPEKFPDMAGFVKKAHSYGIQAALWFPVPFVGKKNPDYEKFRGKMLADSMGAGVLDPRYPEVRDYIVNSYKKILKKYGFDGLKLDFLTDFNRPVPEGGDDGADCVSVAEGVKKLLASIENEVRGLNPDMLIEYREFYVGPSVIRHCNMLRVGDCAFDFITNRNGTVDLRMLGHPLAVHSDMLLWAKDETPRNIAVMLQNVLFAVPQISVLTAEMSAEQKAVIKNHLAFFTKHRELLLHGDMTVFDPQSNYSLVYAENADLRIGVLYLPRVYKFDGKRVFLFNAGSENGIYIDSDLQGFAVCRDIFGNITEKVEFPDGAVKLPVQIGGMAEISVR